jgi:hypothetical protein
MLDCPYKFVVFDSADTLGKPDNRTVAHENAGHARKETSKAVEKAVPPALVRRVPRRRKTCCPSSPSPYELEISVVVLGALEW